MQSMYVAIVSHGMNNLTIMWKTDMSVKIIVECK